MGCLTAVVPQHLSPEQMLASGWVGGLWQSEQFSIGTRLSVLGLATWHHISPLLCWFGSRQEVGAQAGDEAPGLGVVQCPLSAPRLYPELACGRHLSHAGQSGRWQEDGGWAASGGRVLLGPLHWQGRVPGRLSWPPLFPCSFSTVSRISTQLRPPPPHLRHRRWGPRPAPRPLLCILLPFPISFLFLPISPSTTPTPWAPSAPCPAVRHLRPLPSHR